MSSINELKKNHKYIYSSHTSKNCSNCHYHTHEEQYKGVEGMSADLCVLPRELSDHSPVILITTDGVCDSYE